MDKFLASGLGLLLLGLAGAVVPGLAQNAGKDPNQAGATGSVGSTWSSSVSKDGSKPEQTLDSKQMEAVKKVSAYFNDLVNLRGTFVQTDPDKKRARGKFYVKRPGKFRFDYGSPSKKIMISTGRMLYIKDPDIQNPDSVELDNTPFRVLLKKDVDLLRDARITDVQETEDLLSVGVQDKSPDAPGLIRLYFGKRPSLDIKEWVVIDAQGLETRVELSDLNKTDDIDPNMLTAESLLATKVQ
jgi:outer membrane lipoprotein-sorting protein